MAEALVVVLVVGFVLALAGGLLYYKERVGSTENDLAETKVAQDLANDRAAAAEDSAVKRAEQRYEEAVKKAEDATLDSAVRDWIAAGKLWRSDGAGGGKARDPGAL